MAAFTYSKAVVCGIPASLPAAALRQSEPGQGVDLEKARRQHREYVQVLKGLDLEVYELAVDERFPDSVFVEDPVVVCDDTALITIPGHASRRGESAAMRTMMEQLGLKVVEMTVPATMDGGDVLFTGREFFVGISLRTNEEGLAQLAAAFPGYPATGIPVTEGLHLKSFMSMAGPDCIAIGQSEAATSAKKMIGDTAKFKYSFLDCPDDIGANCLFVNGTIVHAAKEDYPGSFDVFTNFSSSAEKIALSSSEVNKVDGCYTCCSVLIK